jgi:hypothetical protein
MTKAGKVWGETRLVTRNPALELHEIAFKAGWQEGYLTHPSGRGRFAA